MKVRTVLPKEIQTILCERLIEEKNFNEMMQIISQFLYASWYAESQFFEIIKKEMLINPVKMLLKNCVQKQFDLPHSKAIENFTIKICRPFLNQKENAKLCENLFSNWWEFSNYKKFYDVAPILKHIASLVGKGLSFCDLNSALYKVKVRQQYLNQFNNIKKITNNFGELNNFILEGYERTHIYVTVDGAKLRTYWASITVLFFGFFMFFMLLEKLVSTVSPAINILDSWPTIFFLATTVTFSARFANDLYGNSFNEKNKRLQFENNFTDYLIAKVLLKSIDQLVIELLRNDKPEIKMITEAGIKQKEKNIKQMSREIVAENNHDFSIPERIKPKYALREKIKTRKKALQNQYDQQRSSHQPTNKDQDIIFKLNDGGEVTYHPESNSSISKIWSNDKYLESYATNKYLLFNKDEVINICGGTKRASQAVKVFKKISKDPKLVPQTNHTGIVYTNEGYKMKIFNAGVGHARLHLKTCAINGGAELLKPVRFSKE